MRMTRSRRRRIIVWKIQFQDFCHHFSSTSSSSSSSGRNIDALQRGKDRQRQWSLIRLDPWREIQSFWIRRLRSSWEQEEEEKEDEEDEKVKEELPLHLHNIYCMTLQRRWWWWRRNRCFWVMELRNRTQRGILILSTSSCAAPPPPVSLVPLVVVVHSDWPGNSKWILTLIN